MSHNHIVFCVTFITPALLLLATGMKLARVCGLSPGWRFLVVAAVITITIVAWPVNGLPLGRYLAGWNANFSIALLVLLIDSIARDSLQFDLLHASGRKTLLQVSLIVALFFYPMALGLGRLDPYAWGWHFSPLFIVTGLFAGALIWRGNRYGLVLLASVVAWHLGLFESDNYWDYLIDPVLCLFGLGYLGKKLAVYACRIFARKRSQAR